MSFNEKSKTTGSIFLTAAALIVSLVGAALLINNIMNYNNIVSGYVSQGNNKAAVTKQLIPALLLPGVFEPIGMYGGLACVLFGLGIINKKVSKEMLNPEVVSNNPDDAEEDIELDGQTEITAENNESENNESENNEAENNKAGDIEAKEDK